MMEMSERNHTSSNLHPTQSQLNRKNTKSNALQELSRYLHPLTLGTLKPEQ